MTLLVMLDPSGADAWEPMRREAFGTGPAAEWQDISLGLRFSQRPSVRGTEGAPDLFVDDDVVVAFEGRMQPYSATQSSAARVAQAYRTKGAECPRSLVGTFAFVLWDRVRRRLLAAADTTGQQTLAYCRVGQGMLVASRALTLREHPRVPRDLDEVYLAQALCDLWMQSPGSTPFSAIQRIRPGWAISFYEGRFSEAQVDRLRPASMSRRVTFTDCVEEFWRLLDGAVGDAMAGPGRVGVALSSGLDSTTVALSALRHVESLDAFSIIAESADGADERALIELFAHDKPSLRLHPVDCSLDRALGEPWDELPIPDDPCVLAAAFLPARIRLARRARELGVGVLLDGEGGDEIFAMSPRFGDLLAERDWGAAFQHAASRGWKSVFARELIVPRLPSLLLRAWVAREQRRRDPIPPWMSEAFRTSEVTRRALRERDKWSRHRRSPGALAALLEVAPTVGSRQAHQLFYADLGLEVRSPMLDRRVLEFVLGVPARFLLDSARSKIFLRRTLAGRVPERIAEQAKHQGLYEWMQVRGLEHESTRVALGSLAELPALRGQVRADVLGRALAGAAAGKRLSMSTAEQVCALFSVGSWLRRLERQSVASGVGP